MNIEEIRALAEICRAEGLSLLEVDQGGAHVRLERPVAPGVPARREGPAPESPEGTRTDGAYAQVNSGAAVPSAVLPVQPEPARPADSACAPDRPQAAPDRGVDFNRVTEVKSPLVGVYYAAPAPDAPPFVKVGDPVKKGDTLCIVEAMKMMNEIAAPRDGQIVDVCLTKSGEVVEFGQTLFTLY